MIAAVRETIVLPDLWIRVVTFLLTVAILALYAYDWSRVYRKWINEPYRTRGIQFRALIRSSVICLIVLIVLIGYTNSLFFSSNPVIREILRFGSYILIGMTLVGGIALVADWRREEPLA